MMPIAGIALLLAGVGSFVAALGTADWRWLIVTAICWAIISAK